MVRGRVGLYLISRVGAWQVNTVVRAIELRGCIGWMSQLGAGVTQVWREAVRESEYSSKLVGS